MGGRAASPEVLQTPSLVPLRRQDLSRAATALYASVPHKF